MKTPHPKSEIDRSTGASEAELMNPNRKEGGLSGIQAKHIAHSKGID